VALKPDDPFSSPDILLPHLGQDFDPSADLLAHKPVPPLVLPRTLHLQISPLENLLQFVNVVTLEVRDYALLQRLVLQKKSVHVNATVKDENWQVLKFLAPVGLIWSNPRFSSASIGEKNDRS